MGAVRNAAAEIKKNPNPPAGPQKPGQPKRIHTDPQRPNQPPASQPHPEHSPHGGNPNSFKSIPWAEINAALPYGNDPDSKAKRLKLWPQVDQNNNGYASLAEVDKAIRDVLRIDAVFNCKRAILQAFTAAKNSQKSKSTRGKDYLERGEFRLFLYYLRQYFEYSQAFTLADTSDDHKISLKEFLSVQSTMEKWVGKIGNPQAEFKKIDKNGGGMITFGEFVQWAMAKSLDIGEGDK